MLICKIFFNRFKKFTFSFSFFFYFILSFFLIDITLLDDNEFDQDQDTNSKGYNWENIIFYTGIGLIVTGLVLCFFVDGDGNWDFSSGAATTNHAAASLPNILNDSAKILGSRICSPSDILIQLSDCQTYIHWSNLTLAQLKALPADTIINVYPKVVAFDADIHKLVYHQIFAQELMQFKLPGSTHF